MAFIAMLTTLALLIGLTIRDHKLITPGGATLACFMWLAAPIVTLIKMRWIGWTPEKTLWVDAGFFAWVVMCGLGRPALLLNTLFQDRPQIPQRLLLRSLVGQICLILGVITFAAIDTLA